MPESIEGAIKAANARLKAAGAGVSVFGRGSKLSLRATLPARDGKGKRQTTIALDVGANPAGLKRAVAEAMELSARIAMGRFSWGETAGVKEPDRTIGGWKESFEREYFDRRGRTPKTETTFRTEYAAIFKKLEDDRPLDREYLIGEILKTEPNTRTRERAIMVIGCLCRHAGMEIGLEKYSGNYAPRTVGHRDIPSDAEIERVSAGIEDTGWRNVYRLLACYGLRNHEVFRLDPGGFDDPDGAIVVLDGKTGSRRVWPFLPSWVDDWGLRGEILLPKVSGRDNAALGHRVSTFFRREGLGKPYNLRHAWAVRTLGLGLDITLAAKQMGHSVRVHQDVYHFFIDESLHREAHDRIRKSIGNDRPKDTDDKGSDPTPT